MKEQAIYQIGLLINSGQLNQDVGHWILSQISPTTAQPPAPADGPKGAKQRSAEPPPPGDGPKG